MNNLYSTGIRPIVDSYLIQKSKERRDYGEYFSASSAGYCMRRVIFDRLQVPHVSTEDDARKQRVFEAGHVFHSFMQGLTRDAGISIAQELELRDEDLHVKGHFDDLVLVKYLEKDYELLQESSEQRIILYDYKTVNSRAFTWQKGKPMSRYHRYQLGSYLYLLHKHTQQNGYEKPFHPYSEVVESRILKISKDDLRLEEQELLWSDELERDVVEYWTELNRCWAEKVIPPCTCHLYEGGFLANEKYNPYFKYGEPCSLQYYQEWKETVSDRETL